MENRNKEGGISVGGVKHCVNLTVISSGFSTTTAISTAKTILNGTYGKKLLSCNCHI